MVWFDWASKFLWAIGGTAGVETRSAVGSRSRRIPDEWSFGVSASLDAEHRGAAMRGLCG